MTGHDHSERAEKPVESAALIQREFARRLRPFTITLALVSLPRVLKILAGKGTPINRLERALTSLLKPSSTSLKLALFPTLLPFIYQTLLPIVSRNVHSRHAYTREITAFLSAPTILLLPAGLRVYLALYAITSAMTTFLKSASPKDLAKKVEEGRTDEKEWRDYLPPVTLINALGNSWMVWSWYHEKGVFPKSYEKLIIDHSPHYVPRSRNPLEIRDFLETTLNPPVPNAAPGSHQWLVCQTLHPDEPSCTKNHVKAWLDGIPQVARWVSGFGALSTLVSFKGRVLKEPVAALKEWLDYTIRGVLYVNGSVQTVWVMTCVLQRLFPGNFMPKNRWVINGSMASLWIYALPAKRQTEISVYVGRIGALSLWRAWRKRGGAYLPYGELLLFALGWNALLQLREGGWKIEGLMRRAILFIEGKEKKLEKARSTWSPDVSRVASSETLGATKGTIDVERTGSSEDEGEPDADAGGLENSRRVQSFASTMSVVTDSGFASEEEGVGDITITSRLGMTPSSSTASV